MDWSSFFWGIGATLVCVGVPAVIWFVKFLKDSANGWW